MSIELENYRKELRSWQLKNFPKDSNAPEWMMVGAIEELGEIARAMLKFHQQIREFKDPEVAKRAISDGYADLNVYLLQVMSIYGIDPEEAMSQTFNHVLSRDWTKNTVNGEVDSTLPNPVEKQ